MKKTIALLMAVILCLCFTACNKETAPEQSSSQINSEESQSNESQNDESQSNESQTESTTNTEKKPENLVYVDRQGTADTVFSEIIITENGDHYDVEIGLYRLTTLYGTAVKNGDVLEYTDSTLGIKGTIKYDDTQAVFEVTESTWDGITVGSSFDFPEISKYMVAYVDRQGTDDTVFSEIIITENSDNYDVEISLYRLTILSGTAVMNGDVLEFTDSTSGVQGTIKYDDTHAVFEVTKSDKETIKVGDKFEFSEKL